MKKLKTILVIITFLFLGSCGFSTDPSNSSSPIETQFIIVNKGSDTIVNLALAWAEEYQNLHPEFQISVTGGGSGTGIAALINNTVDIANASREIKPQEIENAEANGIQPYTIIIARDAIAVIVHPDNPVRELTLQQISEIYSGQIQNWSEVGGEDRPIVLLSRESNSGTHVYFLAEVVRMGEDIDLLFSPTTLLLPSSQGIISEVSQNPNAIGYDGLGYITDEVQVIGIAIDENSPFVYPSVETVNSSQYPIARNLFMYTNGEPEGFLAEYVAWILSPEGQLIVAELGFVPIIVE